MISSAEAPWAVELANFRKCFRPTWTGRSVCAVDGLTLRLAPGQVLGLLGPNGSGKSTTLKALAGLLAPTAGECRVCGHPAGSNAARSLVGYLPESPAFPPYLTGIEFLRYCAGLSGVSEQRVAAVLAWSGLTEAAGRRLLTYSKGMAQRIGLAQAVLHDPQVVLLDEPAGGLDPAGRALLGRLIRDLAARGKSVVFSSHLLAQAEALCDQIAILGEGRLLVAGTTAELLGARPDPVPLLTRLEELYLEKFRRHE